MFDMYGRLVKELLHISGNEIIFHREDLISGLYFIQIISGEKSATQKIIITD